MKINVIKQAGGVMFPADERESERLKKLPNNEVYPIEIKRSRNPSFHGKVFAFFSFTFEHWCASQTNHAHKEEPAQFDAFRKELTVMAGYHDVTYNIGGGTRIEAKSLSYGNMDQSEFEEFYSALINAAIKNVFGGVDDPAINNRLLGFF